MKAGLGPCGKLFSRAVKGGREMTSIEGIEELMVTEAEGDLDVVREDLHVTIRIARDFYEFLKKFAEPPQPYDIDYMMGTIRSGIDEFFLLIYSCSSGIEKEKWIAAFDPLRVWNYPELRREFLSRFESLASPQLDRADRLVSLLLLTHLELMYLAQNFPLAEFAQADIGRSKSPEQIRREFDEALSRVSEWNRKRRESQNSGAG